MYILCFQHCPTILNEDRVTTIMNMLHFISLGETVRQVTHLTESR